MKYLLYLSYICFFYSVGFFHKRLKKQLIIQTYPEFELYFNFTLLIISLLILLYLIYNKLEHKLEHICFLTITSGIIGFYTHDDIYSKSIIILGIIIFFAILIKNIFKFIKSKKHPTT